MTPGPAPGTESAASNRAPTAARRRNAGPELRGHWLTATSRLFRPNGAEIAELRGSRSGSGFASPTPFTHRIGRTRISTTADRSPPSTDERAGDVSGRPWTSASTRPNRTPVRWSPHTSTTVHGLQRADRPIHAECGYSRGNSHRPDPSPQKRCDQGKRGSNRAGVRFPPAPQISSNDYGQARL